MKVKNIAFSGVMAAILGATSANAAVTVASQGYVDSKVGAVETNITNNYLTKGDARNTYATTEYVTENVTNILGNETAGLVADVAANKTAIAGLQSSKADSATTLAGYGITDAYTKTEVDQKYATKDALSAVETTANAAATKSYVDTELGKKADTTAVEAITTSLSNYATTDALDDVKATANAAATKSYVDTEFAKYTKTSDLDSGFVSEDEMTAFKTANTAAINAKVDQSDYDTKVSALEAKDTELAGGISDLETALANKITAPAACETQDCVLSINKATGTIAWVPLTEPVENYLNN